MEATRSPSWTRRRPEEPQELASWSQVASKIAPAAPNWHHMMTLRAHFSASRTHFSASRLNLASNFGVPVPNSEIRAPLSSAKSFLARILWWILHRFRAPNASKTYPPCNHEWRAAKGRPRWITIDFSLAGGRRPLLPRNHCCTYVFKACGIIKLFTKPHQI